MVAFGGRPALLAAACFFCLSGSSFAKVVAGSTEELDKLKKDIGADLFCSACAHSSKSLRLNLAAKINKKDKKKSKREKTTKVMESVCDPGNFPKQLAVSGDEGSKEYMDFQETMNKGGKSVAGLSMKPENNENLGKICLALVGHLKPSIVDKAVSHKERLGGFNWERWACIEQTGLCKETIMDKSDDEDEDKEDEEL